MKLRRRGLRAKERCSMKEQKSAPVRKAKKAPAKHKRIRYESNRPLLRLIGLPALAAVLVLFVELMNRNASIVRLAEYIAGNPFHMFINYLIVLTTLTFSELFIRRRAVLVTTSVIWLVLGIIEYLVVKYRTQPFCSVDVLMLKDAFSLITIYFSWPQIILMFAGGFGVVLLAITMFARMARRRQINRALSSVLFAGMVCVCACVCTLSVRYGYLPQRFDDLVTAYQNYGFATCFTMTFGQQGISRPDSYSSDAVTEILQDIDEIEEAGETEPERKYPEFDESDNLDQPNIIFLQLESFFDVGTIIGGEYSEDPTPNFNRLCTYWPSGELYVPTIGGGTANTEFEVLTGMNLEFFGAGEYPYNTVLQENTCETVCYSLKDYGYTTTAMHNNTGAFYSRNKVYTRLGFDRFVSLEYMQDVSYTDLGWAEDSVLAGEIIRALRSSPDRDMIFTISVESHGKYAETYEHQEGDVEVISLPGEIPMAPFQNFINILTGTDEFLGALLPQLAWFEEPVVLVVYGDHLPALELTSEMLTTGNIYASRYAVWNNFGKTFEAPDLQSYRLSANILKQLGFTGGVITKYHQAADVFDVSEDYLNRLEMLEYDILYGDREVYDGEYPYEPTDMVMGSVPVTIAGWDLRYGRMLVTGENFTEFSTVVINEQPVPTAYVDSGNIIIFTDGLPEFDSFSVAQINKDGVILSSVDSGPMQ